MPYYLARIIGTGAEANPYRPDITDPFVAAIPSQATGAPKHGWALCMTSAIVVETANRERIPPGSLSALNGKQRNNLRDSILAKFGVTVDTSPSRTGEQVAADIHAHLEPGAPLEELRVV